MVVLALGLYQNCSQSELSSRGGSSVQGNNPPTDFCSPEGDCASTRSFTYNPQNDSVMFEGWACKFGVQDSQVLGFNTPFTSFALPANLPSQSQDAETVCGFTNTAFSYAFPSADILELASGSVQIVFQGSGHQVFSVSVNRLRDIVLSGRCTNFPEDFPDACDGDGGSGPPPPPIACSVADQEMQITYGIGDCTESYQEGSIAEINQWQFGFEDLKVCITNVCNGIVGSAPQQTLEFLRGNVFAGTRVDCNSQAFLDVPAQDSGIELEFGKWQFLPAPDDTRIQSLTPIFSLVENFQSNFPIRSEVSFCFQKPVNATDTEVKSIRFSITAKNCGSEILRPNEVCYFEGGFDRPDCNRDRDDPRWPEENINAICRNHDHDLNPDTPPPFNRSISCRNAVGASTSIILTCE